MYRWCRCRIGSRSPAIVTTGTKNMTATANIKKYVFSSQSFLPLIQISIHHLFLLLIEKTKVYLYEFMIID